MEEFYEKFRDKMQDYPRQETDWNMWKKVRKSLNKSKTFIWLPWMVGIAGLMAGIFIGANQFNYNSAVDSQPINSIIDTVFIEKTVIQNDTIYLQSTSIAKGQLINNQNLLKSLSQENDLLKKSLFEIRERYNNSIASLKSFQSKEHLYYNTPANLKSNNNSKAEYANERSLTNTYDLPIYNLTYLQNQIKERRIVINPLSIHTPKISKNILSAIVPDYYDAGIQINIPEFVFYDGYETGFSYGTSVIMDLIFGPKISVRTGAGFNYLSLKTEDRDIFKLYEIPEVPDEYSLKEIYVKKNWFQIPIYLKYNFFKRNNIGCYSLIGTSIDVPLGSNNIFEFNHNGEEIKLNEEERKPSEIFINPGFGIGVEYQFTRQWRIYSELYGNIGLNTTENSSSNMGVGLHLGGMYAF